MVSHLRGIVSCMEGTRSSCGGDGSQTNVSHLVSNQRLFSASFEERQWLGCPASNGFTVSFIPEEIASEHFNYLHPLSYERNMRGIYFLNLLCSALYSRNETVNTSSSEEIASEHFNYFIHLIASDFWSQFLVSASERVVNGSTPGGYDLHLDKIDTNWSEKLPEIDYAVFSDAHWFFRQNYLNQGGNLVGCVYCQTQNVTDLGPGLAIRKVLRTAIKKVHSCKNCRQIFILVRTYSPSHFENGARDKGGGCNKIRPAGKEEIDMDRADFNYHRIQVEEVEIAREAGEAHGHVFEILHVTEMMLIDEAQRAPWSALGNQWMKGYAGNDQEMESQF